ncbi:MAG: hypothetical protein WBA07_08070 [Rivularia sp. (in: cyanobacteria)]
MRNGTGNLEQASQLIREAFENEQTAAELIAHQLDAEPSRLNYGIT